MPALSKTRAIAGEAPFAAKFASDVVRKRASRARTTLRSPTQASVLCDGRIVPLGLFGRSSHARVISGRGGARPLAFEVRRYLPTDNRRDEHQGIGRSEDPVFEQRAIGGKAQRRRCLSNEQPAGHALPGAFAPLFGNLSHDCRQQHD